MEGAVGRSEEEALWTHACYEALPQTYGQEEVGGGLGTLRW